MTRISRIVLILATPGLLTQGLCNPTQARGSTSADDSGKTVTITGTTGVAGVKFKSLPGEPVTDSEGEFSIEVPSDLNGYVMPTKEGYTFNPPFVAFGPNHRINNIHFTARVSTFTISGSVGVADVRMEGLPGNPISRTDGRYAAQVEYGWSGMVSPVKEGHQFQPPARAYAGVTEAQPNQDYAVKLLYPHAVGAPAADDILVIPTREVASQPFAETAEDMRVMLHILREKLSEPRMIHGVLADYGDFFEKDQAVEALYLQGYAAIFMLRADFPLSVPPADRADAPPSEPADPVWEQARNRLYAPQGAGSYGPRGMSREVEQRSFGQLKEDLIKTLRHAANIRHIDPNEWVIVTVTSQTEPALRGGLGGGMYGGMSGMGGMSGRGGMGGFGGGMAGGYASGSSSSFGAGGASARADSRTYSFSGGDSGTTAAGPSGSPRFDAMGRPLPERPAPSSPATVLTIQVRKSDLDALAGGASSVEQFQQKVKVFTY